MKKIRVLYVDDEENPLIIAKTFLEKIDSEMLVNVLSSPEEALKIIDAYQCIITDYRMPKMDGLEFAQKIREKSNVPIILYTAWGDDELFEEANTLGIDECVSKGYTRDHYEVLAKQITSLIKKQSIEPTLHV
jgi:CheY-like chemotaxis protein